MKDLITRTFWGALFVVVLAGSIIAGPYTYGALFLLISVFTLREYYQLCKEAGYSPQFYPGVVVGGLMYWLSFNIAYQNLPFNYYGYLLPLIYAFPVIEMFRKSEKPLQNVALTAFGILLVTIPFSLLNFLVFPVVNGAAKYDYVLLLCLFCFIWASDSGAYLFGVTFGKHRLFERISPKKSWEGFIGGIFTSLLVAYLLSLVFPHYKLAILMSIALIVAIVGTLGDLVESMIKRDVGVKDSGRFMPGHGGLLDRFDSVLLASPIIYFVLQFFSQN